MKRWAKLVLFVFQMFRKLMINTHFNCQNPRNVRQRKLTVYRSTLSISLVEVSIVQSLHCCPSINERRKHSINAAISLKPLIKFSYKDSLLTPNCNQHTSFSQLISIDNGTSLNMFRISEDYSPVKLFSISCNMIVSFGGFLLILPI